MSGRFAVLDSAVEDLERRRRLDRRPLRRVGRYLPPLAVIVLALVAWQLYTVVAHVPDFLLPGPAEIWSSAVAQHDLLLTNAVPTLEIAILGFLLAVCLGFAVAVAIHYSRILELAVYPIVITSQTVPVIALAPILVVLLGFTILPKLIIVCLICFFPIVVNTVDGFNSVDPDLTNLMRTFGAGKWRLFRDVELPSTLPYLFSGAKVAVTYSVVGALFGELVGSSQGLEYLMQQMQSQFETEVSFAAMAILSLMGIGLFAVIAGAERLLLPWYHDDKRRKALQGKGR